MNSMHVYTIPHVHLGYGEVGWRGVVHGGEVADANGPVTLDLGCI